MKPGPKPLLGVRMTQAERQARYRASIGPGATKPRYRRPADRRSRAQRWRDAVAEFVGSSTAEALGVICDLELSELAGIEPPRGFGRD